MSLLSKNFRTGNFRGVEFKVDTVDTDFGRRIVTHEFPQRDVPQSQDLGRKKRDFSIECFVLGVSYDIKRDALISACEKIGIGVLLHPYLGTKNVVCTGCKVREGRADLGIAYFTLSFVEAGQSLFPSAATDRATSLFNVATGAIDAGTSAFGKAFSVASAPSHVFNSAVSTVNSFTALADAQRAKVRATTEALANFTYTVRNLEAQVGDIIKTPSQLAAQIHGVIQGLVDLVPGGSTDMKKVLASLLFYGSDFDAIPLTTANRMLQQENQDAMINLVTRGVVAQQCILATQLTYDSFNDADLYRSELTDSVDAIMEGSEDDDVFQTFQQVRTELVQAVPPANQDLPTLQEFTPQATISSLMLTYNLYQNPDKEAGILARNKIRNPGLISGGIPLEVEGGLT